MNPRVSRFVSIIISPQFPHLYPILKIVIATTRMQCNIPSASSMWPVCMQLRTCFDKRTSIIFINFRSLITTLVNESEGKENLYTSNKNKHQLFGDPCQTLTRSSYIAILPLGPFRLMYTMTFRLRLNREGSKSGIAHIELFTRTLAQHLCRSKWGTPLCVNLAYHSK